MAGGKDGWREGVRKGLREDAAARTRREEA